jgi:hypothetical protein
MKMDVDGEEYALFPVLMLSGGLCDFNMLFMEVHRSEFRGADGVKFNISYIGQIFAEVRRPYPYCRVKVTDLDDESYLAGKSIPLRVAAGQD